MTGSGQAYGLLMTPQTPPGRTEPSRVLFVFLEISQIPARRAVRGDLPFARWAGGFLRALTVGRILILPGGMKDGEAAEP